MPRLPQRGLRDVLGSPYLRQRLALLGGAWLAAGAGYYGLALLADGLSGGGASAGADESVHITLLSGFAYEIPGIAAALLAAERAGRKATSVAALLQGARAAGGGRGRRCWEGEACTGVAGAGSAGAPGVWKRAPARALLCSGSCTLLAPLPLPPQPARAWWWPRSCAAPGGARSRSPHASAWRPPTPRSSCTPRVSCPSRALLAVPAP